MFAWISWFGKGNVVNWDRSDWTLLNMSATNKTYSNICRQGKLGDIMLTGKRNQTSAIALCRKLRGTLAVVDNKSTTERFRDIFVKVPQCWSKAGGGG